MLCVLLCVLCVCLIQLHSCELSWVELIGNTFGNTGKYCNTYWNNCNTAILTTVLDGRDGRQVGCWKTSPVLTGRTVSTGRPDDSCVTALRELLRVVISHWSEWNYKTLISVYSLLSHVSSWLFRKRVSSWLQPLLATSPLPMKLSGLAHILQMAYVGAGSPSTPTATLSAAAVITPLTISRWQFLLTTEFSEA